MSEVQRFARVDVADTGHDALIEQGDFQGDFPVGKAPGERLRVEFAR